jgi:branched-chain amino acid transport system ATP-binding protein
MTSASPVLSARRLEVAYAGNRVLQLDQLDIRAGEIVGVIGANGAGISTLINALLGWSRGRPAVTGDVTLSGRPVGRLPTHERVRAGLLLVPESRLVFSRMTVEENLTPAVAPVDEPGRRYYRRDDVYELFPRLRERRHHLGGQLSGGERQMLGIGRSLMMGPRALLLDEPSIGLAPMLVTQVLQSLRALASAGLAVLLVEQNVRAALQVVDRLLLLERGRLVLQGPAAEVGADPRIAQAYLGAHTA